MLDISIKPIELVVESESSFFFELFLSSLLIDFSSFAFCSCCRRFKTDSSSWLFEFDAVFKFIFIFATGLIAAEELIIGAMPFGANKAERPSSSEEVLVFFGEGETIEVELVVFVGLGCFFVFLGLLLFELGLVDVFSSSLSISSFSRARSFNSSSTFSSRSLKSSLRFFAFALASLR